MTTQHVETLIVGGGQAGLATGHYLQKLQRPFLIVDRNARVGDNWRQHYDSLKLYTPAKYNRLPGMSFPAAHPWVFPAKDEVADYLERYAVHFNLPVRTSTPVDRLAAREGGGYVAMLGNDSVTCDNVVVATGTFGRTPYVPELARRLDPGIRQLHSSQYKSPGQLQDGPALVVGASHSGADIAYELAAGRHTILAGRDCGQIPIRWDSRALRLAMPALVFAWRHVVTRRTPIGRKEMAAVRGHGGPMARVKRDDLEKRGVERYTVRVIGVSSGLPELADGTVLDTRNVVWATGFHQVFDWIDLPVFGADGWPVEYRGVVDRAPGLFFCGLSFQFSHASMVLPGVGHDAKFIARRIAARAPIRRAANVPA